MAKSTKKKQKTYKNFHIELRDLHLEIGILENLATDKFFLDPSRVWTPVWTSLNCLIFL